MIKILHWMSLCNRKVASGYRTKEGFKARMLLCYSIPFVSICNRTFGENNYRNSNLLMGQIIPEIYVSYSYLQSNSLERETCVFYLVREYFLQNGKKNSLNKEGMKMAKIYMYAHGGSGNHGCEAIVPSFAERSRVNLRSRCVSAGRPESDGSNLVEGAAACMANASAWLTTAPPFSSSCVPTLSHGHRRAPIRSARRTWRTGAR